MSSPRHSPPPSAAAPKPKGILKNASERRPSMGTALSEDDVNGKLQWDETNLTLHEIEREQQEARMRIDEPKTPFVHGTTLGPIGDDDGFFALDTQGGSGTSSRRGSTANQVAANTAANAGRASSSGTLNIAIGLDAADVANKNKEVDGDTAAAPPRTTSRSPSFSLPPKSPSSRTSSRSATTNAIDDQRNDLRQQVHDMDIDDDGVVEEEDPDPETQAKHAAFNAKRNQHYGNEAEAMKVAAALAAQDDDEEDEEHETLPNGTL